MQVPSETDVAGLLDRLVADALPGGRGLEAWRALLQAHATLMRQLATELVQETGLTLGDFDVLAQLAAAGGELRMTELAARALSSRSGMTRRIDRLVEEGLVSARQRRCRRPWRRGRADRRRRGPAGRDRTGPPARGRRTCSSRPSMIRSSPCSSGRWTRSPSTARLAERQDAPWYCPLADMLPRPAGKTQLVDQPVRRTPRASVLHWTLIQERNAHERQRG